MIKKCTCQHEFQDVHYGVGMRVHNPCKNGENLRCVVCKKETKK